MKLFLFSAFYKQSSSLSVHIGWASEGASYAVLDQSSLYVFTDKGVPEMIAVCSCCFDIQITDWARTLRLNHGRGSISVVPSALDSNTEGEKGNETPDMARES